MKCGCKFPRMVLLQIYPYIYSVMRLLILTAVHLSSHMLGPATVSFVCETPIFPSPEALSDFAEGLRCPEILVLTWWVLVLERANSIVNQIQ